jgi:hypothetical protein
MAQLASIAKMQFVQLARTEDRTYGKSEADWLEKFEDHKRDENTKDVALMIASYIGGSGKNTRFMTPCSGYGIAEDHICEQLGIPKSHRWFCELNDQRGKYATVHSDHVTLADALNIDIQRDSFHLGYFNPPFDTERKEDGGERLEYRFMSRFVEARGTIVADGVVVMVVPFNTLAGERFVNHLARCYDNLIIRQLPALYRRYNEMVLIGVVRKDFRRLGELHKRAKEITDSLLLDIPDLTYQETPVYTLPRALPMRKIRWHSPHDSTPENAMIDVKTTGGAWSSSAFLKRQARARMAKKVIRPMFPPTANAAILGVASGMINGQELNIGGRTVRVKGVTQESQKVVREVEPTSDGKGERHIKRSIVQRTPLIVTVDNESAAVRMFKGDEGIEKLASLSGAIDELVDAYARTAPPIYQMRIPPQVQKILDSLVPVSGRALRGQKPGLVDMQKHIVAALYQGFTEPDPNTNHVWDQLLLSAEMACGKSLMGASTAEVLRQLAPTNTDRAFTVILTGPSTVIGSREGVYAHDLYHSNPEQYKQEFKRAKTPKHLSKISQWSAEWRDMFPQWHTEVLETPAQVARFFADAKGSTTPRVGFISLSWLALTSGREVGIERHLQGPEGYGPDDDSPESRAQQHQLNLLDDMRAESKAEFERWEKTQKKKTKHDYEERVPYDIDKGLSPYTVNRDKKLRAGTFGRRGNGALYHYEGIYCPTCGRRVVKRDGEPYSEQKFFQEGGKGHKKGMCRFCGTKLMQMARQFDSIRDRGIPLFEDEQYLTYNHVSEVITPVMATEFEVVSENVLLYEAFYTDRTTGKTRAALHQTGIEDELPIMGPVPRTEVRYPSEFLIDGQVYTTITRKVRRPASVKVETRITLPWGHRPTSNPRMALGEFIARRFSGLIDVYISDEIHKQKGMDTDQGAMLGKMVKASIRTLGLTGTVYDGKASGSFSMLQRLRNPFLMHAYSWKDEGDFLRELGIIETIETTTTKESDARKGSGRSDSVYKQEKERSGITAGLAQIIWSQAIIILLKQMGFKLPNYSERLTMLQLPKEVQQAYNELDSWGRDLVKEPGGKTVLSSWLQTCLVFPYAPWDTSVYAECKPLGEIYYPAYGVKGNFDLMMAKIKNTPLPSPLFKPDLILPHHTAITESVLAAKKANNRSVVFVEHTKKGGIQVDIASKITLLGEQAGVSLKVATLGSKVKGPDRVSWFADREEEGVDVVLTHPGLIDTGINLIEWPNLMFGEPGYSLNRALQAKKRAFRPTQTRACDVTWLGYSGTMVSQALDIITTKMLSYALLSGDEVNTGMFRNDDSMSLLQTLAKQVTSGASSEVSADDLAARMAQIGEFVAKDMNQGLKSLVMDPTLTAVDIPAELIEIAELPTPVPMEVVERAAEALAEVLAETLEPEDMFNALSEWVPMSRMKGLAKKGTRGKGEDLQDKVGQFTLPL